MQFDSQPLDSDSMVIASGSTHPDLALATAAALGVALGQTERKMFPNSELYVRYGESIRGKHVFIIQSLAQADGRSVNDAFMELLIMIDAAKRASAAEITAIVPYLAYGRQDRKARGREPISAATVIRAMQSAGADRLVSIDMHSAQTQATFNGPFDHLTAEHVIKDALLDRIAAQIDHYVMVSPDGGRAKVTEEYASMLGLDVVHMTKSRDRDDSSVIKRPDTVDGVAGKICLIVDDIIDTAGTVVSAAETLQRSGAAGVIICATHGLFSDPAIDRLITAPISEIIVTDTVPTTDAKDRLGDRLTVLPTAPMIAETISAIANRGSVSRIFNDRNYY